MTAQTTTTSEDIRSIIDRARTGYETALPEEDCEKLVTEIERNLYDGASFEERYETITQALTTRIEREPAFKQIAAEVFRERYYREVIGEHLTGYDLDLEYRATFRQNIERAVQEEL